MSSIPNNKSYLNSLKFLWKYCLYFAIHLELPYIQWVLTCTYGCNITTLSLYKWNLFFVRNIVRCWVVVSISIWFKSVQWTEITGSITFILTMHNKSIMCNRLAKFMCRKNIYHIKLITAIIFEKKSFSVAKFSLISFRPFVCRAFLYGMVKMERSNFEC